MLTAAYLFSCKQDELSNTGDPPKKSNTKIDIDFNSAKFDHFNSIFNDIEFILLDSEHKEAFFDWSDEMIITNDYIIIHEVAYNLDNNILVFSKDGKFIKKYEGSSHRGPGSFSTASDVIFDASTNRIEIFDRLTKKIVIFDVNSELFDEIYIDLEDVDAFQKMAGKYYLYVNSEFLPYNIYVTDEKGKIKNKLFKHQKAFSVIHGNPDIFYVDSKNNEILYKHTFGDTLYRINRNDKVFVKEIYNNLSGLNDSYLALRIKQLYDLNAFREASLILPDIKRDSTYANCGQWKITGDLYLTFFAFKNVIVWVAKNNRSREYNLILLREPEVKDFFKYLLIPRFVDNEFIYALTDSDEFLDNYNYLLQHEPDKLNIIQKNSPENYWKYIDCIAKITSNSNSVLLKAKLDLNYLD